MYRVRTIFSGVTGAPYVNTLFFDSGGGTAAQAATAAGVFWGAADAQINSSCTWEQEAEVDELVAATGNLTSITAITAAAGTGGDSTVMLSPLQQVLIRLRTGVVVGDRELVGRIFVPANTEAGNDTGGVVISTWRAAYNTAIANLISDANSTLVVWHRPSGPDATDGISHPVVSGQTQSKWSYLSSRRE